MRPAARPTRGRRSRQVLVAVAAAGLALSACLPPEPPPPENGRLPDASLTVISPACRILDELAPELQQMLDDANRAGVPLAPETASYALVEAPEKSACYRSYDMQVFWHDYWCFFGDCNMAAVPGTSVHGWARAVDFECGGNRMTFDDPCYAWLSSSAGGYGFVHPAWAEPGQPEAEPWHWEAP